MNITSLIAKTALLSLAPLLLSGCMVRPPVPREPTHTPPLNAAQPYKPNRLPSDPVPQSTGETRPSAEKPEEVPYDFSKPAPQSPPVDNGYFADAAFIGDSRTDGFMLYSGIGQGDNLTSNGLSIFQLNKKKVLTIEGEHYTLLEALAMKDYGKVYLSLGINELGYHNNQGFYDSYAQTVDTIRALQPNAVIYLQSLIPVNEQVIASTGGSEYLKNDKILVYNQLIQQVAQEKQVVFLDLNPEFTGPDGQLPEDASGDGVHLRRDYCKAWLSYLKTHTVSFDTLYPAKEGNL